MSLSIEEWDFLISEEKEEICDRCHQPMKEHDDGECPREIRED